MEAKPTIVPLVIADITLITATGSRPAAFALCETMLSRQTAWNKYSIQWIVVDDSAPVTKCTLGQEYLRGPKPWSPNINTQRYNVDEALRYAKGDYIFFIEDDDYYHPSFLERYMDIFKGANPDVIGEGDARYYNIQIPGYKSMRNFEHSSLSQTAFKAEHLPLFNEALHSGELYFDIQFWKKAKEKELHTAILSRSGLSVGMKGLPGRTGIGVGHKKTNDFYYDPEYKMLQKWIGEDIDLYRIFIEEVKNANSKKKA